MKMKPTRTKLIAALEGGDYIAQPREDEPSKNLLATGDVEASEVVEMLKACRGEYFDSDVLHGESETMVYIFKPMYQGDRWYIKGYFVEQPATGEIAVFISVHT